MTNTERYLKENITEEEIKKMSKEIASCLVLNERLIELYSNDIVMYFKLIGGDIDD